MRTSFLVHLIVLVAITSRAADIPKPPEPVDFRLVKWAEVSDYLARVDAASDRVVVRELGKTTEGRPYLAAFVSSAETIADLDRHRRMQESIARAEADPSVIAQSKAVVIVTCSIHSTETASTFMAMRLLHELASGDDKATREILDNTILILVPSANPDGVDIVANWYDQTKGKPWEGDGLPRLYHKYAGHDTNRDWFMLNLKETQLLTHLLYKEWFPTLAYDVHQMGSRGARLFVPPFFDPINPNLDARVNQGIAMIGAHMAADLAERHKTGILTHAMYDNWWNGGNRTTPQRHNIVAVLTEAASVRLASPIFLDKDDLRGFTRGFASHKPAVNFVEPWPGGWWRLGDIEQYERICARSLLTLAARYKDRFQRDYLQMGLDAIKTGRAEPPFAWIVPAGGADPGRAADMVRILHDTGIRVERARSPFHAGGVSYPEGTWVMRASQPYRAHLKDMMERQDYPPRFGPDGLAEPPYDVAGWTLPLQMGVRSVAVGEPLSAELEAIEPVRPDGGYDGDLKAARSFVIANRADDDFAVLNALHRAGVEVRRVGVPGPALREAGVEAGSYLVAAGDESKKALDAVIPSVTTRVRVLGQNLEAFIRQDSTPVPARRIGLYQPWVPSMDEGWTRLILEKYRFPYLTLHNGEIRVGRLKDRVDTLLIPSIDAKVIRDGFAAGETEPAYVGGLGKEGVDALRGFCRDGGNIVCLEDACNYAIEDLGLGVTNVVKGLRSSEFYGPGSIVRVKHLPADANNVLTIGMPEEGSAYFDRSMAFEVDKGVFPIVATRYADGDVLQSGWLQGESKIRGKAALLELPFEGGHVILFGFPPQHRGQPRGTFRLLFNALLR